MGIFTARDRKSSAAASEVRVTTGRGPAGTAASVPRESMGLPVGFEAVGEALLTQSCPLAACAEIGRQMAVDGATVGETLAGLRTTWHAAYAGDPDFDAVSALVAAWSESTLAVVNDISCEDPLTGLGSVAHLRSCVAALHRAQRHGSVHPRDSHALVVIDLGSSDDPTGPGPNTISRALRMATLGEGARTVFPGSEVIGRLNGHRIAVLGARDSRLGVRVRLLRRLVDGMALSGQAPRVWIEGLGPTELASSHLLDDLARS